MTHMHIHVLYNLKGKFKVRNYMILMTMMNEMLRHDGGSLL